MGGVLPANGDKTRTSPASFLIDGKALTEIYSQNGFKKHIENLKKFV